MVTLRTLHAKNQPPRPKTVAYRPRTDTHTDRQTDRQRKQTLRTPFFEKKKNNCLANYAKSLLVWKIIAILS